MGRQKWINEVVAVNNFPEHDYHVHIGSLMKVLQCNPNNISHEFPYIETRKKQQEDIVKGKLNIGLVLETSRISNAHDDESICLLYTSPSPRDRQKSRMPSSA